MRRNKGRKLARQAGRSDIPEFYECGNCSAFHSANWMGDCREDAARFFTEDLDDKYGSTGWSEIRWEDAVERLLQAANERYAAGYSAGSDAVTRLQRKLDSLREHTVARGASKAEAATAKRIAARLAKKIEKMK